jgi:hypothetical protein
VAEIVDGVAEIALGRRDRRADCRRLRVVCLHRNGAAEILDGVIEIALAEIGIAAVEKGARAADRDG